MFLTQFYVVLLFLILSVRSVNSPAKQRRSYHTANYVNNKIYFLGGKTDTANYTNDFFYLDVSVPFNIDSLPMIDNLTSNLPSHRKAMSTVCGPNHNTIFLFGGEYNISSNYIYKFDTGVWKAIINNESTPKLRKWMAGTCDKNKMYVFGGSNDTNQTTTQYYNEFDILDTLNTDQPNWNSVNISSLSGRDIATATLLRDGRIVYLGGNIDDYGDGYVSMKEITLYDTNKGEWINMTTNGYEPKARGLHTAVLTNDGRIIVYGGETEFNSAAINGSSVPATDPLIVLDTTTENFTWTHYDIPFPSSPAVYRGHTATLVNNYMFIAFGAFSNSDDGASFSDKIHILDVSDRNDYKWVTDFTPQKTITLPPPLDAEKLPRSPYPIIGGILGGVVGLLLIATIILLIYRKYFRKRNTTTGIPTAGTEREDDLDKPYSFARSLKIS